MPGHWSYKVGPCEGVDIGDQIWLSRYLLSRCSENFNLQVSLEAKPVPGDWPSCGAFVKYSTTQTRCVGFPATVTPLITILHVSSTLNQPHLQ